MKIMQQHSTFNRTTGYDGVGGGGWWSKVLLQKYRRKHTHMHTLSSPVRLGTGMTKTDTSKRLALDTKANTRNNDDDWWLAVRAAVSVHSDCINKTKCSCGQLIIKIYVCS